MMVQPVSTLAKLVTSVLRVDRAHAERMQFENFARQIFVQAAAAIDAGDGIRSDRLGIVEIDQHRRVAFGGEQHVGETAEHIGADRFALVAAGLDGALRH